MNRRYGIWYFVQICGPRKRRNVHYNRGKSSCALSVWHISCSISTVDVRNGRLYEVRYTQVDRELAICPKVPTRPASTVPPASPPYTRPPTTVPPTPKASKTPKVSQRALASEKSEELVCEEEEEMEEEEEDVEEECECVLVFYSGMLNCLVLVLLPHAKRHRIENVHIKHELHVTYANPLKYTYTDSVKL